jgi:hypothetical protein
VKIVGKAKGKAPKAWCLMQNSKTGHYYVGYDDYWPLHGSFDEVTKKVAELKANAKPEPVVGPEVKWPGFHPHGRPAHAAPLTQQQLDDYAAYEKYNREVYAHQQWEKDEVRQQIVAFDYVPVFEDILKFTGYTRGRSSVTMQFEASNGQTIEFGPSGIDGLIQGIIDGVAKPEFIAGTLEKGIKARFKFVKKGQNTYAELTED